MKSYLNSIIKCKLNRRSTAVELYNRVGICLLKIRLTCRLIKKRIRLHLILTCHAVKIVKYRCTKLLSLILYYAARECNSNHEIILIKLIQSLLKLIRLSGGLRGRCCLRLLLLLCCCLHL